MPPSSPVGVHSKVPGCGIVSPEGPLNESMLALCTVQDRGPCARTSNTTRAFVVPCGPTRFDETKRSPGSSSNSRFRGRVFDRRVPADSRSKYPFATGRKPRLPRAYSTRHASRSLPVVTVSLLVTGAPVGGEKDAAAFAEHGKNLQKVGKGFAAILAGAPDIVMLNEC